MCSRSCGYPIGQSGCSGATYKIVEVQAKRFSKRSRQNVIWECILESAGLVSWDFSGFLEHALHPWWAEKHLGTHNTPKNRRRTVLRIFYIWINRTNSICQKMSQAGTNIYKNYSWGRISKIPVHVRTKKERKKNNQCGGKKSYKVIGLGHAHLGFKSEYR